MIRRLGAARGWKGPRMTMEPAQEASAFPPTRWTLVSEVSAENEERRLAALQAFLELYHPVLVRFVRAHFGMSAEDGQDCVQDFVLDRILRKRLLDRADRERGRFRTFLCQSLSRYAIDRLRRLGAQKRLPLAGLVSLDHLREEEEPVVDTVVHDGFDREFFCGLVGEALRRMRHRCRTSDREALWTVFEERVLGQALEDTLPVPYARLLPRLGLESAAQAANLLIASKRMFERVLRGVLRDYEATDSGVSEELDRMWRVLSEGKS